MVMAMASLGTACLSSKCLTRPQASGKLNFGLRSVSAARPLASLSSSFMSGVSLAPKTSFSIVVTQRCRTVQVRAGKPALGCTKRSRSRKAIARTSGFRVRLQTPSGRNVLKRRRAKGRKVLCPASNPNSGKRA